MLTRLSPTQFHAGLDIGRTRPCRITCEKPDGTQVDVIAKFSAGSDVGEGGLAAEVIAACLAADLGLPIPQPYLIEMDDEWIAAVPNADRRKLMESSSRVAFGSTLMTGGFSTWPPGKKILDVMLPQSLSIFAFDALIQNPDRRTGNPNCLVRGTDMRIIDHELAFSHRLVLGWQPPWNLGGLSALETPGVHIFREELRGRCGTMTDIRQAWRSLTDDQIEEYCGAVPSEWGAATTTVQAAKKLLSQVRDRVDDCVKEIIRVLS